MPLVEFPPLEGPNSNANDLFKWLQESPQKEVASSAQGLFQQLLTNASQPRGSTSDACVKLCGFVQLCAKSKEDSLKYWAFSEKTSLDLFNFFIEWNERDQHRSMRLVLDLLTLLITQNPLPEVRDTVKTDLLCTMASVIARKSTRPLVKSCITALSHLLAKSILTLEDVAQMYRCLRPELSEQPAIILWQEWVADIFRWMELNYVCPVAGKFLVILFGGLSDSTASSGYREEGTPVLDAPTIRKWLETALATNPDLLESIKNYFLAPLFKSDRALSIALLEELHHAQPEDDTRRPRNDELDTAALLHLAALELGKKAAIVEEPRPGQSTTTSSVELDGKVLGRFLVHNSYDVRSFAMSLLISSSSSTRPFSTMAFELLRKHLRSCHADPDAKFRNEILGISKNMIKRLNGAIATLEKDLARTKAKASASQVRETAVNTHISKGAKEISNAGETWLCDTLENHKIFFGWYLQFLKQELAPTASYQRHITALKAFVAIIKSRKDNPSVLEQKFYTDSQWIRIILDLIMDPFDDVRETATGLLMLLPPEYTQKEVAGNTTLANSTPLAMLSEFTSRAAAQASRTSRADHSDGAARSSGLLCAWETTLERRLSLLSRVLDTLEAKISRAEKNLAYAVMAEPVHGDFAAVRCMWQVLSKARYSETQLQLFAPAQTRIVDLCTRIWGAVSHVLCDDSPEGKVLENNDGLDSKGLLSYSFRAIHESSQLMRTMVGNLGSSRAAGFLLPTPEVFRRVGNLAFSQLSTLRHRGAFSSVSLNFTCCCQNAQNSHVASGENEQPLLEDWYKGALSCIYAQRSTTRRSAGIPALITAILASNATSPSFDQVIRTLEDIAQRPASVSETDGSNLPQVHAFNSLKEVFKTSLLSRKAERHLPRCLELATNSLKSEVWAIRNCALLLLRSLMDGIFGTGESKSALEAGWDGKTLRVSYTKYPSLPPILLHLLQSGSLAMEPGTLTSSSAAESVFPALDIIRRAGPPESHRDELFRLIVRYLGSQQWHVREIAARTLCSFLLNQGWLSSVQLLLNESRGSANRLHGTFLTLKFFLERTFMDRNEGRLLGQTTTPELDGDSQLARFSEDSKKLGRLLEEFELDATICSEVWAAFVEVRTLTWEIMPPPTSVQLSKAEQLTHVKIAQGRSSFTSVALLDHRLGIRSLREAVSLTGIEGLKACLFDALDLDTDTACMLLEAVPTIWGKSRASELCKLYLDLCKHTKVPEARAQALTNLAELLDDHISHGKLQDVPSPEELETFQQSLLDGFNPTLANAVLLASGPVMAIQTLPHNGQLSFFMFEQRLRAWGKTVADALDDSNTCAMRMAAASAIRSFTAAVRSAAGGDAAYLPLLLALYNTLIDDDDEIRDVGAAATALVTSSDPHPQPLVAVDAADALLSWLRQRFGHTNEFRAYVACRLVGDPLIALDIGVQDLDAWAAPEQLFAEALEVDESLFAVEDQNLFTDEVRETQRWADVFNALPRDYDQTGGDGGVAGKVLVMDSSLDALKGWVEKALDALLAQVRHDDGPLGWASNADAFALCHRVLVCGKVMAELLGEEDVGISGFLARVKDIGQASRLHSLLLYTLD